MPLFKIHKKIGEQYLIDSCFTRLTVGSTSPHSGIPYTDLQAYRRVGFGFMDQYLIGSSAGPAYSNTALPRLVLRLVPTTIQGDPLPGAPKRNVDPIPWV